jgi:hypothetical protein
MNSPLTILDAQIAMEGCDPERAERISQMILSRVERRIAEVRDRRTSRGVPAELVVPAFAVDWDATSDNAIAERGADAILAGLGVE